MLNFALNPFPWREGEPINGVVASLSITRENGSVIPVSNLSEEIEVRWGFFVLKIFIKALASRIVYRYYIVRTLYLCCFVFQIILPRPEVEVNSTFLDLGNYSTLVINVTTPNISLVLKLDPSEEIPLHLLLGFEHYPNNTHYKTTIQLPQAGNSTGYSLTDI